MVPGKKIRFLPGIWHGIQYTYPQSETVFFMERIETVYTTTFVLIVHSNHAG